MLPLNGVKVLDLSRLLPGPLASLVLADLGAQVDKLDIERILFAGAFQNPLGGVIGEPAGSG